MIAPAATSDGMLSPRYMIPIHVSSSVPAIIRPVCRSPSTRPVSVAVTKGLFTIASPRNLLLEYAKNATNATKKA